jgi:hypothetical protein
MKRSQLLSLDSLRKLCFRANPEYTLLSENELSEYQRTACQHLADDPEFYGILVPKNSTLPLKAIDSGDALLFLQLQNPGCMPDYFFRSQEKFGDYLQRLLLDQIIEAEVDGSFISGPTMLTSTEAEPEFRSISDRALFYGAQLPIRDHAALTGRLYFFNRIPTGISACRQLGDRDSVKEYLGVSKDSNFFRELSFKEIAPKPQTDGWIIWASSHRRRSKKANCKLYFCIHPQALPKFFLSCTAIAAQSGAISVKVGSNRFALNRPDKFVAYFNTQDDMQACAAELGPLLGGLPAHELPFSAALPLPTLAWGLDPPKPTNITHWWQVESWRVWVAKKLAIALIMAKDNGCNAVESVQFAKKRVELEGINTSDWTPIGVAFD